MLKWRKFARRSGPGSGIGERVSSADVWRVMRGHLACHARTFGVSCADAFRFNPLARKEKPIPPRSPPISPSEGEVEGRWARSLLGAWAVRQSAMGRPAIMAPKSRNMLLYKREVLGGDPSPMDPYGSYWSGGTLKAPAVQKKRQATPRRKPPIASAQHPESGVRDVKVCGGQECVGWHIVGPCRTIRRLTARVRASP